MQYSSQPQDFNKSNNEFLNESILKSISVPYQHLSDIDPK